MSDRVERYTTTSGEVIEYPKPNADVAAFLARVIAATNDPRVTEAELTELVYGRENPILDHGIFPGRGAVTPQVFANPLYRVFTDLITQKSILEGTFVPARDRASYTLTVAEAAERIGVTPDAVRKAIRAKRLPASHRQGTYLIDPRDADTYRDLVLPRGVPRKGAASSDDSEPAIRARCGSEPGRSLRIKGPDTVVVEKRGNVVDVEARTFDRAIVATSGPSTQHAYELEPATETSRIEWGPFFVEGRFRIAREITNTRDASAAWHSFGSILPTVVLDAMNTWIAGNVTTATVARDQWAAFAVENDALLRPLAKALRSRARTEFLQRAAEHS